MTVANKYLNIVALIFLAATLHIWYEDLPNAVILTFLVANACLLVISILITKHSNPFAWLAERPIRFYWFAICVSLSIIIPLGVSNDIDYWNDVLVEAHGLIFDLIVFGILLTSYEAIKNKLLVEAAEKSEKKLTIARYQEEIDDFRDWKTSEAKIRIRGNIRRANKLNHNTFNLTSVDLSAIGLQNVNLTKSDLTDAIFSNSNMANCTMIAVMGSSTKFNGKDAFLLNADFTNAELLYVEFRRCFLNGADFTNASLSNVDFRKADLRNAKWNNTYFYNPNFIEARVDEDFLNRLRESNIRGHRVYDWYTIKKADVPNHPGNFEYTLWPIPTNERDTEVYNT